MTITPSDTRPTTTHPTTTRPTTTRHLTVPDRIARLVTATPTPKGDHPCNCC